MNPVIENNLKLLKEFQPNVYKKIYAYMNNQYSATNNKTVDKILLARQDDLIINMLVVCKGREYLLCNHEDPINQAYEWIDKYVDPTRKTFIVYGMGFGYHIEVLLTSFKDKKVIIIEPDIDLFYQIISIRNMELIIEKSEIYLDENNEAVVNELTGLFYDTGEGGVQFQPFEVYSEMFDSQWEDIRNRFIKRAESFTVDVATRRYFGELFIYNNIKNSSSIKDAADAGALAGKFEGVPAVLVSAGPSLEQDIPLLKALKDKCILIAAGTAVNILEEYGITPHFMMGIDAGKGEGDIHRKVKSREIYFIYSNQVATESVSAYAGPKFIMNYSADEFTRDFFKYSGIITQMYNSGPSVSNTCFDLLYKMGCNPIILVGQDLSLTDNREYAGSAEGMIIDKNTDIKEKGLICVKDKTGRDVLTRYDYIAIRNWFEGYFEKLSGKVDIINATKRGLNIEFCKNDSLQGVMEKYSFEDRDIDGFIRNIYESNKLSSDSAKMLKEFREKLYNGLLELEDYSKKQLKVLDLIKRDVYHPAKSKNAFDRTAGQVSEFTEKVLKSQAYNVLLKNILGMDFFLIKREVDLATKHLSTYAEVKDFYIKAIDRQNEILMDKINKLKKLLKE